MGQRNSGHVSRRELCALCGGAVVGSVAGCLGSGSSVSVLSAGSLATTFEDHVGPAFREETGLEVHGEYYGTNALMRWIEDGTKHPDVVVSADATLLRERFYGEFTDWDLEFAANSVGLAYDEGTEFGAALEDGQPWYELARETAEGDLAISDPDLDPLGYRAIQAFELAEAEYGLEGFREDLEELAYVEPEEPQLLAGVETGTRVAAVAYRNMAVDHGMAFHEFPDAYNFADPSLAEHYGTVEYTTDEGYTAEGRPVLYNATVLESADDPEGGRELLRFLAEEGELLENAGLTVTESLPRPHGEPPEGVVP